MKVLITGAFGNLGISTIKALLETDHDITLFDLPNSRNKKLLRRLSKRRELSVIWGDLLDKSKVTQAVINQDCIIHLVGLTPPLTEQIPRFAYQVNVQGTKNIVEPLLKLEKPPKIIYPSSVSIYSPTSPNSPLLKPEDSVKPTDVYTRTKCEVEQILQESKLPWLIFRTTAVPGLDLKSNNRIELMYEIPLDQKVEFLHTYDAGLALANAVDLGIEKKILLLGGGKECQMINRDFLGKYFRFLGLGKLLKEIFKKPKVDTDWYYTHWMDTSESQNLLDYQKHSFEDFLEDFKKGKKVLIFFMTLFRPLIKLMIKKNSPYSAK